MPLFQEPKEGYPIWHPKVDRNYGALVRRGFHRLIQARNCKSLRLEGNGFLTLADVLINMRSSLENLFVLLFFRFPLRLSDPSTQLHHQFCNGRPREFARLDESIR